MTPPTSTTNSNNNASSIHSYPLHTLPHTPPLMSPTSPRPSHPDVIILVAADGASHTFNARELRHFAPKLAGPHGYVRTLSDDTVENTKTLEALAALVSYGTVDTHHTPGELFALLAFLQKWALPSLIAAFVHQVVHAVWRRDHALHPQLAFALAAEAGARDACREILFLAPLELGLGDEDGERQEYWDGVPSQYRIAAERACESVAGLEGIDKKLEALPEAFDRSFTPAK